MVWSSGSEFSATESLIRLLRFISTTESPQTKINAQEHLCFMYSIRSHALPLETVQNIKRQLKPLHKTAAAEQQTANARSKLAQFFYAVPESLAHNVLCCSEIKAFKDNDFVSGKLRKVTQYGLSATNPSQPGSLTYSASICNCLSFCFVWDIHIVRVCVCVWVWVWVCMCVRARACVRASVRERARPEAPKTRYFSSSSEEVETKKQICIQKLCRWKCSDIYFVTPSVLAHYPRQIPVGISPAWLPPPPRCSPFRHSFSLSLPPSLPPSFLLYPHLNKTTLGPVSLPDYMTTDSAEP